MDTTGCVTEAIGGSGNKTSANAEYFEAFDFLWLFFFFHSPQSFLGEVKVQFSGRIAVLHEITPLHFKGEQVLFPPIVTLSVKKNTFKDAFMI